MNGLNYDKPRSRYIRRANKGGFEVKGGEPSKGDYIPIRIENNNDFELISDQDFKGGDISATCICGRELNNKAMAVRVECKCGRIYEVNGEPLISFTIEKPKNINFGTPNKPKRDLK